MIFLHGFFLDSQEIPKICVDGEKFRGSVSASVTRCITKKSSWSSNDTIPSMEWLKENKYKILTGVGVCGIGYGIYLFNQPDESVVRKGMLYACKHAVSTQCAMSRVWCEQFIITWWNCVWWRTRDSNHVDIILCCTQTRHAPLIIAAVVDGGGSCGWCGVLVGMSCMYP